MNGDRRRSRILDHSRQRRRVPLAVVPAGAHLDRDRDADGLHHPANHRRRVPRLTHEAASGIVLGDLRDRTPHVHVDDVRAHAFDHLRRRRHLLGIAAEDLNRDRPLFFRVLGELERAVDAAHQPFRADHLGDHESAAAVPLDQAAECAVGHAGHRRDGEG